MYDVIVADPPWPLKKIQRRVRPNQKPSLDYSTMSISNIWALPVNRLANNPCTLFLWTVHKFLPQALDILSGWGFTYHIALTWDKNNGLCQYGFHRRTELVLVGFKGAHDMFPRRKAFPAVFAAKSPAHSTKPDIFYDYAARFGSPRIDLFARTPRPGWGVWGNEVSSDIPADPLRW